MSKFILIVEDDLDDQEMLQDTIDKVDPCAQVKFSENGRSALEYLYELKEARLPLPGLIILDLNMPYVDGIHTFQKLRDDTHLSTIPVAVFTSSQNPNDRALFERMGVTFITKPYDFYDMTPIVQRLLAVTNQNAN
jgi:CheY-like chemotaxis protein